jgi:hypothetical protein
LLNEISIFIKLFTPLKQSFSIIVILFLLIFKYCSWHRTFYFLSNLIVLDLSYNKLVTLYRNVFNGLNRLKSLNLKGNYFLKTLESGAFFSLSNVKRLEIVGTKIFRLKPGTFMGLDLNLIQ